MNYHNITKHDMLNGEGLRTVLWTSGCEHGCKGCHNPGTWDKNGGLLFDEAAKQELFQSLEDPYTEGVTFSGGDPLHTDHRYEVLSLMKEIREKYPDKTIWCYTGYRLEELAGIDASFANELVSYADVLVDGRFEESLKKESYPWAGSTNQRVLRSDDMKEIMQSLELEEVER